MQAESAAGFLERLRAQLAARQRHSEPAAGHVEAAVLLALVEHAGQLQVLFTKRSERVAQHQGQVSFPGGVREPADVSPWATALRETAEELGLPESRVRRLGLLDDYVTITGFRVTPCVGHVPELGPLTPQAAEIDSWFLVPLAWLRQPAHCRREALEWQGRQHWFYVFDTAPHPVWGATAFMLRRFLDLLPTEPPA